MQKQLLKIKRGKPKNATLERGVIICLVCGSENTCVNHYGLYCRNCGFLWNYEWDENNKEVI